MMIAPLLGTRIAIVLQKSSFFLSGRRERASEKLPTTTPTPHQKRQLKNDDNNQKQRVYFQHTCFNTNSTQDSHKLYVQGKGLKISLGRLLRRTFRVASNQNQVDGQFPLD